MDGRLNYGRFQRESHAPRHLTGSPGKCLRAWFVGYHGHSGKSGYLRIPETLIADSA